MPTIAATAAELEGHDGLSIAELPFWARMQAEMNLIAAEVGTDEIDGFEKSDLIACQIRQILAL